MIDEVSAMEELEKRRMYGKPPAGQPHPQDVLYLVNETLIAAIGEWDKGPHDINRILQLLRACPAHTSAPAPAAGEYIISFDHFMAIKETAYPITIEERRRICDAARPVSDGAKAAREQVLKLVWIEVQSCGVSKEVFEGISRNVIAKSVRTQQEPQQEGRR